MQMKPTKQNPYSEGADCKSLCWVRPFRALKEDIDREGHSWATAQHAQQPCSFYNQKCWLPLKSFSLIMFLAWLALSHGKTDRFISSKRMRQAFPPNIFFLFFSFFFFLFNTLKGTSTLTSISINSYVSEVGKRQVFSGFIRKANQKKKKKKRLG